MAQKRSFNWAVRTSISRSGAVLWHADGRWVPELTRAGIFADHQDALNAIAICDPEIPLSYMIVKIGRGMPPERWMELSDDVRR